VRRMRHGGTGQTFAVKVIPLGVGEEVQNRIVQELKILHDCGPCPHIVSFHEASYWDGAICVVLEYMDGGALSDVIGRVGPLPEPIVSNIALHVAHGLEFLHRKHLIHRDIKPSNILLNSGGPVKIADFGVSGELANSLAETASWCGTMTYMSPERIQGASYSYDSDVWALGLSVMECALGRFPYTHASEDPAAIFWDLLHQIVQNAVPELPEGYSEDFSTFVTACLAKEPSRRPTAADLLDTAFLGIAADDTYVANWISEELKTDQGSPNKEVVDIRDHGL